MSDITVNITTISTSVNVTDNEVSVAVSFIPVDVTLNFEYGVSRAVIDSLLTKENITGLKETDSPKFASLQSKALQSATNGGQIPDTDYSWFKGLFAGLQDKFIFSWIYGLITLVKDALTRIGLLEDKYILRYVAPVDTSSIDLTTDKYGNQFDFVEGDKIVIIILVSKFTLNGVNRIFIRFNDISSKVYYFNTVYTNYILTAGNSYYGQWLTLTLDCFKNEVKGKVETIVDAANTGFNNSLTYQIATTGLNLSSINKINIGLISSSNQIPAGTVILIKNR